MNITGNISNRLGLRPSIKGNPGFSLNSVNSRSRSKQSHQIGGGLRSFEAPNDNQSYNNNGLDHLMNWHDYNKQKKSN